MSGTIEARLAELGVDLPTAVAPAGSYIPTVRTGNLIFVSGQLPFDANGGLPYKGKVGEDISLEDAQAAARLCAVNILVQLKAHLGDLDAITQIVKLTGFVNAPVGFGQEPQVINGASNFLGEVFGDSGRHARAAVGVASLPLNVAVEIEAVVEVSS